MAKKEVASFYNSKGKLFVDCTECKLGFFGNKKCSAGEEIDKPKQGGCLVGTLIPGIKVNLIVDHSGSGRFG